MKDKTYIFLCIYCGVVGLCVKYEYYAFGFVFIAPILRIMKEKDQ